MNLSHVFPLLLACAISLPAMAQTNDARIYTPPESMAKNIRLYSSTENSVTFRFSVK